MASVPARRRATRHLVSVCLTASLLVGAMLPASATSGDATGTGRVVGVVGDSYVSGEGLVDAEGRCGRSADAWGDRVGAQLGASDVRVAACSGATIADLTVGGAISTEAQLATVSAAGPVDVLLLTAAGNDLGFTQLVADCLGFADLNIAPSTDALSTSTWTALLGRGVDGGCTTSAGELRARVDGLADQDRFALPDGTRGGLAEVYAAAATEVTDGGELVVVGYPQLFAPPGRWLERYGQRCHGLRARDADAIDAATVRLDALLAEEVARADALVGGRVGLRFVSVIEAFDSAVPGEGHHGLCGGDDPWLHGLVVVEGGIDVGALLTQLGTSGGFGAAGGFDIEALGGRPGGSFHPNASGHAAYTAAVLDAIDARS